MRNLTRVKKQVVKKDTCMVVFFQFPSSSSFHITQIFLLVITHSSLIINTVITSFISLQCPPPSSLFFTFRPFSIDITL